MIPFIDLKTLDDSCKLFENALKIVEENYHERLLRMNYHDQKFAALAAKMQTVEVRLNELRTLILESPVYAGESLGWLQLRTDRWNAIREKAYESLD